MDIWSMHTQTQIIVNKIVLRFMGPVHAIKLYTWKPGGKPLKALYCEMENKHNCKYHV